MFLIQSATKKKGFNSEVREYQCNLRSIMFSEIIDMITSIINDGGDVGHPNASLRWHHRSFQGQY